MAKEEQGTKKIYLEGDFQKVYQDNSVNVYLKETGEEVIPKDYYVDANYIYDKVFAVTNRKGSTFILNDGKIFIGGVKSYELLTLNGEKCLYINNKLVYDLHGNIIRYNYELRKID